MLRAIALDFDGAIVESMDLKARVFRTLLQAGRAVAGQIQQLYEQTVGLPLSEQLSRAPEFRWTPHWGA